MSVRKRTVSRISALLLALVMMLSLLPTSVLATSSEPTVVIAGSDFQNSKGNDAGAQTVTNILAQIKNAGYTEADGFLFCGDYDYDTVGSTSSTEAGITALKNAVTGSYSALTDDRMVFVEGNHDAADASGLATSGAHDATEYGVFVINEDDYMWNNSNEATIKNTAAALETYLNEKVAANYDKPIFVLSHLPLHYSMRTKNDGDGRYANYIFDVLNEAGANGLNIIFLYGHDHSNGWDDYLGGSAVYLAKGDQINIAQASKTEFNVETLNFTYMNAGFTGYYSLVNTGAETTLTMTVFEIKDDTVTVARYDANGKHNLKSAGVTNSHKNESGYAPNTTVYESPQTIALGSVTSLVTKTVGNVSVTAPGLTGLTATKNDVSVDTTMYSAYASYDITPEGYTRGDKATVTVTLDEADGFVASREVTVIDQTGTNPNTTVPITGGKVTFTTTHFSTYDIAQAAPAEPTERTYTLVTGETELVSGDQYLLIYNGTQFVLPEIVTKSNSSGSQRTGMDLEDTSVASGGPATITGQYQAKEWQLVNSSGSWLLSNGAQQIKLTSTGNQGITATFEDEGSPFSLNFNTSHLVSFTHGSWELNYNADRGLINGYDSSSAAARMYIYRLTDAGTVDPSGGNWVTISDGQGKTIFRLVDQLTAGKKYLIVSSKQAGSANAVNLNGENINSAPVTIIADPDGNYIEAPANTAQWKYTDKSKFQNVSSTGTYLRGDKSGESVRTTTDSGKGYTTWSYDNGNGLYTTKDGKKYYISYSSSNFTMSTSSSNRVYIYEEATLPTTIEYAKLTGSLEYTVVPGTSTEEALAAVKAGIDVVTSPDKTNVTTLPDDNANIKWTLDSSYNGEAGEYAVTISYKNKVLGTAKVIVPALTVAKIEVAPMEGTVQKGASNYAKTGSKLTVTYSDGSTRTVDVTLGMLSGTFDKNTVGDYTGLTVTYGGKMAAGYTLHVTPKTGNNYPEYPHEGAVRVGKTGEGIDFQSSGIAKVELSATGVPVKKGADVIIMVDTSSSMTTTVDGSSKSRIQVLRESLEKLLTQFQKPGEDGEPQDIRVAIADFNGYVSSGEDNTPYRLKSVDHLKGTTTRSGSNTAQVYTGSAQLNAGAFVTASDAASVINGIETHSGTNYDYAFDATYQLGKAILAQNAQNGEERDLFVIFMSDGAPFQYNYFSSQSEAANWNNWLQGTVTNTMWDSNAHNYFYNGSGNKHRMAEAIKGNPDAKYTVIRKDSTDNYGGQQYMTQLPGLGATMYSIGFCLEQDKQITVASMEYVLKNISSDPAKFYYKVNSANELTSAFAAIGNEIAYAATNARFVDTMGANYDLQMKSSTYTLSDGTTKTITPKIIVQAYDIYTKADNVAASEIGKRKGTSTVLETVTFNADGTEAYSDKKSGNILIDGVICANTFWYNTTSRAFSIDTNGDGTNDYNLAPETFYWKMGTINQTELALSYYVYLTGSMEGKRKAGSYPTNDSATLYYTNWLGNEAEKDTVSPVLAWQSANVSYAFYLVDENGKIIVNKATGATGSFANKVAVTNPVVYSEVLLNSAANVEANIFASGVLPEGYTLYDASAAYNVRINSNSTGGWTITKGKDPATTYVTEYGGDPTTDLTVSANSYDYTHTVVWFAVKYTVGAIKDAVVIDYGLPVDISVLSNDMFYESGTLAAVGPQRDGTAHEAALATGFGGSYTAMYGTATVNGSYVRYQVKDMNMTASDTFSYAVNYQGNASTQEGDKGYYYGQVTVIPATTIYYEDSFVTFKGNWTAEGTTDTTAAQSEDRPGTTSVTTIDANNVYGMDGAYKNYTTYSLGSAHKATVTAGNPVTAEFSFTGTGFDVISLTDNTSGFITVKVTDKDGNPEKNLIVNNYFAKTGDISSLYQIPVMKVEGLPYGQHKVKINVAYNSFADPEKHNSTTFILDAIRIYDPAGNDPTDVTVKNAYIADKEYKPVYETVRNMLVEAKTLGSTGENTTGICFVETKEQETDIASYANIGPNNECYLANGQAIAFSTTIGANTVASLQLGAKAPAGAGAKLNVQLKVGDSEVKTAEFEVNTATDLYYDLSKLVDLTNGGVYTFVISNTGSSLLSLTNFKTTTAATGNTAGAYSLAPVVNNDTVTFAKASMTRLFVAAPVVEEPTEPEIFTPDTFSAKLKKSSVKVGDKVTVTVTTSNDVESVTVNGEQVMTCRTDRKTGNLTWTYSFKATQAGESEVNVVAYDSNGTASEAIVETLTVRENVRASIVDKISNAIKKLFGWLAR